MAEPIFHIAVESLWRDARSTGGYRESTRGATLDEIGFVHAAFEGQVQGVYERFYADVDDSLVLLVIDPDKLRSPVELAVDEVTGETFPHILGPIDRSAVVEVRRLPVVPERPGRSGPQGESPADNRAIDWHDWRVLAPLLVFVGLALGALLGYAVGRA